METRPAHVAILMWPSKPKKAIPLGMIQRGIDRFIVCAPRQRQFVEQELGVPSSASSTCGSAPIRGSGVR